jgi:maltose alpha-D-glucosyltransferase/alpha-amylase
MKKDAETLLSLENQLLKKFRSILDRKTGGRRIRIHGDFHLGQVLFTGRDFVIIDFEGEPARPLGERRIKRSPLRDVAGMLRSFDYAAYATLPGYGVSSVVRSEDLPVLEPWVRFWSTWSSSVFLVSYLEKIKGAKLLPSSAVGRELLLKFLILEKLVYELGYELNNRPHWLRIPAQAIIQELEDNE